MDDGRDRLLTEVEYRRVATKRDELASGRIVPRPRCGGLHGMTTARIARLLGRDPRTEATGWLLLGAGFVLARGPDTVRGPDVAFVRRGQPGARIGPHFIEGAPDLAVEVLDGSDAPGLVLARLVEFLDAGTPTVWCVDPAARAVTVLTPHDRPRRVAGGDPLPEVAALPWLRLRVDDLFAGVPDPPGSERQDHGGAPGA